MVLKSGKQEKVKVQLNIASKNKYVKKNPTFNLIKISLGNFVFCVTVSKTLNPTVHLFKVSVLFAQLPTKLTGFK